MRTTKYWRGVFRSNVKLARAMWGELSPTALKSLRELTSQYHLSIAHGDVQQLDGRWYITHSGLLRISRSNRCFGIRVNPLIGFCNAESRRWVFRAVVYRSIGSKGFVGYGDADPSNVSTVVRGAEMRVAETRAVNRALRKAYGIGLCSVEELGWEPSPYREPDPRKAPSVAVTNDHQNGHARLRDRLCLLIRQHQLDANLVKAYAT